MFVMRLEDFTLVTYKKESQVLAGGRASCCSTRCRETVFLGSRKVLERKVMHQAEEKGNETSKD